MKNLIFFFVASLFTINAFSHNGNQDIRTLEYEFKYSGKEIVLDLGCDVEVKPWKGDVLKIMVYIEYPNEGPALIKELAKMERYDLSVYSGAAIEVISMPNLNEIVTINGEYLVEEVSVKVLVPVETRPSVLDDGNISLAPSKANKESNLVAAGF